MARLTPNTIADVIRAYRVKHGLSQDALARDLGITQSQVGKLEAGSDLPSIPTVQRIAKVLKLTPYEVGALVLNSEGRRPGPRVAEKHNALPRCA